MTEGFPKSEVLSESRAHLERLEKEGKYLFHGSPISNIHELEPRQSHTIPPGEKDPIPDGDPSVAATPYVDIAIFRALLRRGRSSFSGSTNEDGSITITYKANKKAIELMEPQGYVYVLPKELFKPYRHERGIEWRSDRNVEAVEIVPVSLEDLPKDIESIEE